MFQVKKIIEAQKSKGVNVVKYMECSALLQTNVKNVFDEAVKLAIAEDETENPQKTCTIIWGDNVGENRIFHETVTF